MMASVVELQALSAAILRTMAEDWRADMERFLAEAAQTLDFLGECRDAAESAQERERFDMAIRLLREAVRHETVVLDELKDRQAADGD